MIWRICGIFGTLTSVILTLGAGIVLVTATFSGYRGTATVVTLLFVGLVMGSVVLFIFWKEPTSTPYW